jgi:alpha-L-rhamnosidase
MKLFSIIFILFLTGICSAFAQNRPSGLLTDLLAHTDRVSVNGRLSSMTLTDINNAIEPVQCDEVRSSRPAFSWIVPGKENDTRQIAYQIILSDSLEAIKAGRGNVWDSKKVLSKSSVAVIYGGKDLLPGHTYFWQVRCTTNKGGDSDWSEVKAFRTADHLEIYSSSHEELQKTEEHPLNLKRLGADLHAGDFGRDAFGQLSVRLFSETGSDTVGISMGELLSAGRINKMPGGTIRYQHVKLALEKGWHVYQIKTQKDIRNTGPAAVRMPGYIGEALPFRYVEVSGYNLLIPKEDITREFVHYPFDDLAADFKCSNEELNKIWELCRYSIKATSFAGVYVDGDRERIPYEADALINQLGHYGTDREYSMARRSLEYLLKQPTWPTEWILQALIIAWNDYLYTGDARSLELNYQLLKNRALMQLREKNGLISTNTGLQNPEFAAGINFKDKIRDIVDWPLPETDGFVFSQFNAVTNAYHYRALVLLEQIANTLRKYEDVSFYEAEHKRFKKTYNRIFLDLQRGVYKDGDTTNHSALHSNMFAFHFGLVPDEYQKSVMDFIVSRGMACSVYGSQFLLDALYDGENGKAALDLLTAKTDRSWYNMLRLGSTITLEAWDNKFKPNQDWNHAWGAAPANIIPRRLLGIEAVKPGFEAVSIRPQIADLSFANATVPTIRGSIEISIQNNSKYILHFRLPANMEADVYLPILTAKRKLTHNGKTVTAKFPKGKTFIYAGKVSSGNHEFILSE